jgi:hypothetical protein
MTSLRRSIQAVALALALPAVATAQTDNRLAVGGAVGLRASGRTDATGDLNPVFIWRIGHAGPGWGFRYGFPWYETDLARSLGGRVEPFGRLNVRPIMAGYGYRFAVGRVTTMSANLKGGYAFSSFAMQPTFGDRYQSTLSVQGVSVDAANTFVVQPELTAWIDIGRKVGLNITTGYMIARPHVALRTAAGSDRRRVDADMFMMKIGAVYSIF